MRKRRYTYSGFVCLFIILIILSNFGRNIYAQFGGDRYRVDYIFPPDPILGDDFQIYPYMALRLLYGLPLYQERDYGDPRQRELDEHYKQLLGDLPEEIKNWRIQVHILPWNFLPLGAYLSIPFTWIAHPWVYRILLCLLLLSLFYIIYLLSRYSGSKAIYWMISAVLVMFSYPLLFQLERGDLDMFALLLIVIAFIGWREKGSSLSVGLCIALAVHLKMYPLIFLFYFFLKKEWRICFSICFFTFLFLLVCALASREGIVEGFAQYGRLYQFMKDEFILGHVCIFAGNHSTFNFLTFLFEEWNLSNTQLFRVSNIINVAFLAFVSLVIVARKARDTLSYLLDFSLIIIVMTITPSHGNDYTLVLLYFVFLSCFICFERLDFNLFRTRVLFVLFSVNAIILFLPTMTYPFWQPTLGYFTRFWFLSNKWPFLVSLLVIIWLLRRAVILLDGNRRIEEY